MFADDHHLEHIQAALEGTGHTTVETSTVGPGEDGGPTATYTRYDFDSDGNVDMMVVDEDSDGHPETIFRDIDDNGHAHFIARDVPSMGYKTYEVTTAAGSSRLSPVRSAPRIRMPGLPPCAAG